MAFGWSLLVEEVVSAPLRITYYLHWQFGPLPGNEINHALGSGFVLDEYSFATRLTCAHLKSLWHSRHCRPSPSFIISFVLCFYALTSASIKRTRNTQPHACAHFVQRRDQAWSTRHRHLVCSQVTPQIQLQHAHPRLRCEARKTSHNTHQPSTSHTRSQHAEHHSPSSEQTTRASDAGSTSVYTMP
jgi:hypothetical protein